MNKDFDLFEKCKIGDAQAQRILYDLFKGKLMGLCRRYTRSREEAQDVLQDAFVKIFTKFAQVTSSDKMESWMKSVVVHTAINHYRRTKTKHELILQVDKVEEEDIRYTHPDLLADEHLVAMINALPDGCRLVFNLFAMEGYSHTEIAAMLEVTESTSRSQYHHAKYLLKEKLKCQDRLRYYEKFA